jgi:transcriptional regulator with XRE-family HTH domain
MAKSHDAEVARFAEYLSVLVRLSGHTRQSVEELAGMSSGYLSKILSGTVELRMRHVMMILGAIGLQPSDVFPQAFQPTPRSDIEREKARRMLEGAGDTFGRTPSPAPESAEDFDEKVRLAVGRLLGLTLPELRS